MIGIESILDALERVRIVFIPMVMGIVLHEVAHGWVASLRGDLTARMLGRLTLNPMKHVDPMGLTVFGLTAMFSPVAFGWAKPVPVNPMNMYNPQKDMMLVAAAGPAVNFMLALLFAFCLNLIFALRPESFVEQSGLMAFLAKMCSAGIMVNFVLALINLIPIPPFDGSRIVAGFLPPRWAWQYYQLERYGFLIVMVLLMSGVVGRVLSPLLSSFWEFAINITDII